MTAVTIAGAPTTSAFVEHVPGHVHVRPGVIDKVAREATAVAIGTRRDDIRVEVSEWSGGLAVHVSAKLPVPSLDDTEAIHAGMPVVDRVRALQTVLAVDMERLTGRSVPRVTFTVTGAIVPKRKRVR